jgi:hypothetical protein
MKREDSRQSWDAWRRADTAETAESGDRAFAELTRGWERAVVPAGLAARIAAAAAQAYRPSLWASGWLQAAAVTALVVTGVVLGAMSGAAVRQLALVSFRAVVVGLGTVHQLAVAWTSLVGAVIHPASGVARALAGSLASPMPLFVIAVNFGIAAAALAVLRRVLALREV